jgi:hypothetical protein
MPLRIFISSPGDVPAARLRAVLVIDKLALEFRLTAREQRWPRLIRERLAKLQP